MRPILKNKDWFFSIFLAYREYNCKWSTSERLKKVQLRLVFTVNVFILFIYEITIQVDLYVHLVSSAVYPTYIQQRYVLLLRTGNKMNIIGKKSSFDMINLFNLETWPQPLDTFRNAPSQINPNLAIPWESLGPLLFFKHYIKLVVGKA